MHPANCRNIVSTLISSSLLSSVAMAQDSADEASIITALSPASVAEAPEAAASPDPAPDESGIETISVYATRTPSLAFDYAGQVSVIDRGEIMDFNPSTLQDIFQAVPGATFDSGARRTGDAPSIRGLSGNGVLIFIDGARQSFLSGHDGRLFLDPELIKSVEVVRGPSSALYGSGALGGVIATTTVSAKDYLEDGETMALRMHTGFQSVNDEFRVGLTGAWASEDGRYDLIGHYTYRDSGTISLGSGFDLPADDEIGSAMVKGMLRPSEGLEITAAYMQYKTDSTDPQNPQGQSVAGPDNALVFRDATNRTGQGGLKWTPESPLIDLTMALYYSENTVEEDEVESPRTVDRSVETIGLMIDNRSRFVVSDTAKVILTYGGEFYRDQQTGTDNNTADGSRGGVPDAQTSFFGAFVQAELSVETPLGLPGSLTVTPGMRWDSFETTSDGDDFVINANQLTPKIGATYKPIPEIMVFGSYSEGFRAPNFNEAFADGAHFNIPDLSAPPGPFGPRFVANLFIGNADLRSEVSQTWEGGIGFTIADLLLDDDQFDIKASYHRSDVDNLIGLDVNTPVGCFVPGNPFVPPCGSGPAFGNTSQNVNIRNATIDGFEVEFTYNSELFYARGNFSNIDGVDDATGEFLEGTLTADTFFLDAGLRYAPWGLRIGSRLTLAGDFTDVNDPLEERDGFFIGDIYAVVEQPLTDSIDMRVDLGVDNIGNANFEIVNAGVSQPGRNYKAALALRVGF